MNADRSIKVLEFREKNAGGTLRGFANLQLASGLIIKDVGVHIRDSGAKWISMPSRRYEANGETKYFPYVDFKDAATKANFQKQTLAALAEYIKPDREQNADTSFTADMSDEEAEASKQRCAQAAAGVRENARRFERARPGEAGSEKRP
jgi:DNA-binding cell septation regulator SpoVG